MGKYKYCRQVLILGLKTSLSGCGGLNDFQSGVRFDGVVILSKGSFLIGDFCSLL
jgi:hypothetical protein